MRQKCWFSCVLYNFLWSRTHTKLEVSMWLLPLFCALPTKKNDRRCLAQTPKFKGQTLHKHFVIKHNEIHWKQTLIYLHNQYLHKLMVNFRILSNFLMIFHKRYSQMSPSFVNSHNRNDKKKIWIWEKVKNIDFSKETY